MKTKAFRRRLKNHDEHGLFRGANPIEERDAYERVDMDVMRFAIRE